MSKLHKILGGVAAVVAGDFLLVYILFYTILKFGTPERPYGLGQDIVIGIASCVFFAIGWGWPFLFIVGLSGWIVPGGGYLLLKETKRGLIIFVTITLTFCLGIYISSIGVVDWIGSELWFLLQIANTPLVAIIGYFTEGGGYPVFGRPCEIGQIYTGTAGWLNLLCIVNSVYMAYLKKTR
jgi:hypothetical protein